MVYTESISIKRAIVHKVDHVNATMPVLSDVELELDTQVQKFLGLHISQARQHRYTRQGRFHPVPDSRSPGKIYLVDETDAILNEHEDDAEASQIFVASSRTIAESLFEAIRGNKTISVSDLIICIFSAPGSQVMQLAVLKMDPYEGFVTTTSIENGQTKVKLEQVPSVISSEGLQKCAFMLSHAQRADAGYDLEVLDAQNAHGGYVKQAAGFFVTDFLECDVNLDATDKTNLFLRETFAFAQRRKDEWSEEEIERFKSGASQAMRQHDLDIIDFAQQYTPEGEDPETLLNTLQGKGLSDRTFQPNAADVAQWTDLALFEGDDGLQLKFAIDDTEFFRNEEAALLNTPLIDLLGQNEEKSVLILEDNNETIIVIRTNSFRRKLSKTSRSR